MQKAVAGKGISSDVRRMLLRRSTRSLSGCGCSSGFAARVDGIANFQVFMSLRHSVAPRVRSSMSSLGAVRSTR
eukprot:4718316-Lingulodinium_polyedra.AAC.1